MSAASTDSPRRAVVLLSGGLDSATVAAWLQGEGFSVHALSVDYRQRHAVELDAARRVAAELGLAEHLVVPLDLRGIGGSALTGDTAVPKADDPSAPVAADIPVTYVPARNTIFLSLALALAEARGAHDLGIGVNALDYSGYPDCRPEFIAAFGQLANLATREGVEGRPFTLHTPLQELDKRAILRRACALGVPVDATVSCYDPDERGRPCRHCDSCRLRQRAEARLAWGGDGAGPEDALRVAPQGVTLHEDVPAEEVHALRHRVLRPQLPYSSAVYDCDGEPGTWHCVARQGEEVVGCATLLEDAAHGVGCRVRGMAVEPRLQGTGLGAALLRACMREAARRGTGIWCQARSNTVPFYAGCAFRRVGAEFDMPDLGPHFTVMWPGPRVLP